MIEYKEILNRNVHRSRHLSIRNFGPIVQLDMNLKKFNILIGPQASGKSTAAKLDFFFHLIPLILDKVSSSTLIKPDNLFSSGIRILRGVLTTLFDKNILRKGSIAEYRFISPKTQKQESIIIEPNKASNRLYKANIKFSPNLQSIIQEYMQSIRDNNLNTDFRSEINLFTNSFIDRKIGIENSNIFDKIFGMENTTIFVPACRFRFSLDKQDRKTDVSDFQPEIDIFANSIPKLTRIYADGLESVEYKYKLLLLKQPDQHIAEMARIIIHSILRGRFVSHREVPYIKYDAGESPLSYASSGQQEAVWMLLIAYDLILKRQANSTFFEEPEAHLYPEAQYSLIKIFSLLSKANSANSIMLTTHSPYILTAVNNLLAAGSEGEKNKEAINKIIPRELWLTLKDLSAYAIDNDGRGEDILDMDLGMIKAEKIDTASTLMNEEYDKIMEITEGIDE